MRMICAAAVLAALAIPASAKDDPHGPQWHFMDKSAFAPGACQRRRNGRRVHKGHRLEGRLVYHEMTDASP